MSVYDTKEYKDSIKRRYRYEWWVEHVDEFDDIQDCYEISLPQWADEEIKEECTSVRLCLRRLAGSEANGIDEISYAYVINEDLEAKFCSGHKVPSKYICELSNFFLAK